MEKKSVRFYIRQLHRDLGFLAIGLVLMFSLSGIVLVFRDAGFMKVDRPIERTLPAGMNGEELGKTLQMKKFKVVKENENEVVFAEGSYNKLSGEAHYSLSEYRAPMKQMVALHMKASRSDATHIFSIILGVVLAFLAVSSFWMFPPKTKLFKRGMIMAAAGVALTVVLLCLA